MDSKILCLQDQLDNFDKENIWGSEVNKCRLELSSCNSKRESMSRQNARINLHLQGDKNTKFFNQIIQKRSRNRISRVTLGNSFLNKPAHIRDVFFRHFKGIFNKMPQGY